MNRTLESENIVSEKSFFSSICDDYFYSSEWFTFTACIYISFEIIFWLYNSFLLYIEYNDVPAIERYRIQKHRPKLRFQPETIRQIKIETIKHQLTVIVFLSVIYPLLNLNGHVSVRAPIPSYGIILWQIMFCILVDDFVFFWTHYLFHTRWLYKYIHKKHHTFKQPTGLVAVLANPWEAIFQNQLGVWLGAYLINDKHIFTLCLWIAIRTYQTVNGHSGYEIPYISPEYYFPWLFSGTIQHDYHHQYGRMNYGSFFTLWDRLLKTHKIEKDE